MCSRYIAGSIAYGVRQCKVVIAQISSPITVKPHSNSFDSFRSLAIWMFNFRLSTSIPHFVALFLTLCYVTLPTSSMPSGIINTNRQTMPKPYILLATATSIHNVITSRSNSDIWERQNVLYMPLSWIVIVLSRSWMIYPVINSPVIITRKCTFTKSIFSPILWIHRITTYTCGIKTKSSLRL